MQTFVVCLLVRILDPSSNFLKYDLKERLEQDFSRMMF